MNRRIGIVLVLALGGCGPSEVQKQVQDELKLYADYADQVAAAKDLTALNNAIANFESRKTEWQKKTSLVPTDEFLKAQKPSADKLQASKDRAARGLQDFLTNQVSNPGNPWVRIETNLGNMDVELFENAAPITVKNFLDYVGQKFYDGVLFHRVAPNRVIQAGGYTEDFRPKPPGSAIKNESSNMIPNVRWTLGMARLQHPDSAAAQFFINTADNHAFNLRINKTGYAVFGRVMGGADTVEKIAAVQTQDQKLDREVLANVPVEPVIIKSIRRIPGP